MTARFVDGQEVLVDEPTESQITTTKGKPIVWQQIRTLLLADGSTVYGCAHCDYVGPSPLQVRPHLNKHRNRPTDEMSLTDLINRVAALDRVTTERDEWKARALSAEKRLKTLRSALGRES